MAYTEIDDSGLFFNIKLYTGNSGTQTLTGVGFQPNLTWIKQRSDNTDNTLYDSVRGATYRIRSNSAVVEATDVGLTAWNSDGFNIGNHDSTNLNNGTYVGWNWKAETAFSNDASATSVGSIDSAGSVNTDAGFSIISYTGTGANATIAHGLGSVPKMYIARNITDAENWTTYHVVMGATHHLRLNTNVAKVDEAEVWNDTEPTSTVFSVGSSGAPNGDGDAHIAYCFAEIPGYSKFESYIGNNNADGPFIYTGFKTAMVIIKRIDDADNWVIYDNKRDGFNGDTHALFPNNSDAQTTDVDIDLLSNGFKIVRASGRVNASGGSFIYMAFAENPLVTSKGVPATAR